MTYPRELAHPRSEFIGQDVVVGTAHGGGVRWHRSVVAKARPWLTIEGTISPRSECRLYKSLPSTSSATAIGRPGGPQPRGWSPAAHVQDADN